MPKRTKKEQTHQTDTRPARASLVDTAVVAVALGRTRKNVRQLMENGALPGRKLGGRWVMTRAEWKQVQETFLLSKSGDSVNGRVGAPEGVAA